MRTFRRQHERLGFANESILAFVICRCVITFISVMFLLSPLARGMILGACILGWRGSGSLDLWYAYPREQARLHVFYESTILQSFVAFLIMANFVLTAAEKQLNAEEGAACPCDLVSQPLPRLTRTKTTQVHRPTTPSKRPTWHLLLSFWWVDWIRYVCTKHCQNISD